jgi:ATP-dependent exoDNAse (exonuclease V) beta subunit
VRRLERFTAATSSAPEKTATPCANVDPKEFAGIWKARAARRQKAEETTLVMTPTSVGAGLVPARWSNTDSMESNSMDLDSTNLNSISSRADGHSRADTHFRAGTRPAPTLLGSLVHRFLESWDFTCEKCSMPTSLTRIANSFFAQEGLPDQPELVKEAQKILTDFIGSETYGEIKGSEILGREIPFFYAMNDPVGAGPRGRPQSGFHSKSMDPMPFDPNFGQAQGPAPTLLRGTIDILYRLPSGQVVIGDYKTGQTKQDYEAQGQAYKEAVKRVLGEDAAFKIISLRS